MLCLLEFGKRKLEEGYIIGFKEKSEYKCKDIVRIEDNMLTAQNIEFAKLMARRYFCNVSDCVKLMLQPGKANRTVENRVTEKTRDFVYIKCVHPDCEGNVGAGVRGSPATERVVEDADPYRTDDHRLHLHKNNNMY